MRILLTGGVGYISSHTAIALAKEGHSITILDDLSNSKIYVIDQIKKN
jgi:UDP-glucose 4-epimerase